MTKRASSLNKVIIISSSSRSSSTDQKFTNGLKDLPYPKILQKDYTHPLSLDSPGADLAHSTIRFSEA